MRDYSPATPRFPIKEFHRISSKPADELDR